MNTNLDEENFLTKAYVFRDRQAGVSVIYDPFKEAFCYNAYCVETSLVKEIYALEFSFLQDALDHVNEEFGNWELTSLESEKASGCSSCVAKK
ncbi:MAG: hypothetical protein AB7T49_16670 [Oligoflexales bacterium]